MRRTTNNKKQQNNNSKQPTENDKKIIEKYWDIFKNINPERAFTSELLKDIQQNALFDPEFDFDEFMADFSNLECITFHPIDDLYVPNEAYKTCYFDNMTR
nr:MAG: hypothetical protein [Helarchaeota virus Nidhogg Meg22_1214]